MDQNSKQFKQLQAEWDKKLKDSGFVDIEQDGQLKDWAITLRSKHKNPVISSAKQEYYRAAGHFLYDHAFNNAVERRIWELHADGKFIKDIVETLQKESLWFTSRYSKDGGNIKVITGAATTDSRGNRKMKPNKRIVHEIIQNIAKLMLLSVKKDNDDDI